MVDGAQCRVVFLEEEFTVDGRVLVVDCHCM